MVDETTLLPSASAIYERLTINQRERHRLRTLLRLVRHAEDDRRSPAQDRQPADTSPKELAS
jgi:hypothetical protein